MKQIRSTVILATTGLLYLWLSFLLGQADLFVTHTLLRCVVQVGICIVLLPLVSVELQQYKTVRIIRGILLLMTLNLLIQGRPIWFGNMEWMDEVQLSFRLGALTIFHLGLAIFVRYKERVLMTRTSFTPPILFLTGVNVFSLFVSAMFALLIGGGYEKIQLSCEDIIPRAEVLLQSMPIDMLGDSLATGEEDISAMLDELDLLEHMDSETLELYNLNERVQAELDQYRHLLVQDFVGPKTEIDQQYCELIVGQLAENSKMPGFRMSAVVLLFVLFSPIVALVLNILMGIGALVLYVLILLGVYKREERQMIGKGLS